MHRYLSSCRMFCNSYKFTTTKNMTIVASLLTSALVAPWIIEKRNGLEMCVGGKIKTWSVASPFEAIRVYRSWKHSVIWHQACQNSAGCSPFFLRVFKCHMAAMFLRPQKVFLIWFAAHENHSYLFLPCRTTIIALVDHLAVSASCLREGKDYPEARGRSKTKILQERCVSDGRYCLFLFQSWRFNWILVFFVNQISKEFEPFKILSVSLMYKLFNVYCIATTIGVIVIAWTDKTCSLYSVCLAGSSQ